MAEKVTKERGKSKESEEVLRTSPEETEGAKCSRKEKRVHIEEDEYTDSDSHCRRKRTKVVLTSDSEQEKEGDGSRTRISMQKKAMFGDIKFCRELVITEEIEAYRPLPEEEKQFLKMTEFSGTGDLKDHCDKYELVITGMSHSQAMLCKIFRTY
ncbi:hypothetical protein AgCh_033998 [Apium graveolens]